MSVTSTEKPAVADAPVIQPNRIGVTDHPTSRTTRYYYTSGLLTNRHQSNSLTSAKELTKGTDKATRALVKAILAIEGVASIMWLESNRLILVINPMYFWSQINDAVIEALTARIGATPETTSVLSYEDFQKLAASNDANTIPDSVLS